MEYRKLPHGEEQISIIGLGNSSLTSQVGEKEIQATVEMALESGVNYFDMAAGDAAPFAAYGKALAGCREKAYLQVHFGADYRTGKYGWTLELEDIKRSVAWQLDALKTDYIDFGFLHCIDETADLEKAEAHGTLEYLKELKRQGAVRHIGLSSHTPQVVHKVLDMGLIDLLMFSINPAYDYRHGEFAIGEVDERVNVLRFDREGADSLVLLGHVAARVRQAGYEVENIDATVLCQRPKLAPHIPAMRRNIADAFGLPVDAVSVKATTEEHLGFTGEGLGIAAHAVALIE